MIRCHLITTLHICRGVKMMAHQEPVLCNGVKTLPHVTNSLTISLTMPVFSIVDDGIQR